MAAQWSNWEDSRQLPVGHPTLPLRYLTEFRHCCSNLPQQQDTIPPWPQHEKLGGWKESGVVPSSMRNWEMYKSHCVAICMVLVLRLLQEQERFHRGRWLTVDQSTHHKDAIVHHSSSKIGAC